jgi:hypothetical protein
MSYSYLLKHLLVRYCTVVEEGNAYSLYLVTNVQLLLATQLTLITH